MGGITGWFDSFFFSFIVGETMDWYGVNWNTIKRIDWMEIVHFTLISVCLWLNWYPRGLWKTMTDVKQAQKSSKFIHIFGNGWDFFEETACSAWFATAGTSTEATICSFSAPLLLAESTSDDSFAATPVDFREGWGFTLVFSRDIFRFNLLLAVHVDSSSWKNIEESSEVGAKKFDFFFGGW